MAIRNPIERGWSQLHDAALAFGSAGRAVRRMQDTLHSPAPTVRRITTSDIWDVLELGLQDFGAYRTDVLFLCAIYPVAGLILSRLAFGYDLLPLLFPLASGFALIGPFAGIGLYELSRRRELGETVRWIDAFKVLQAPSIGAIGIMGLLLAVIYVVWLGAAQVIYDITLGPEPPASLGHFIDDLFTTSAGWELMVVGIGVGFLFAVVVLAISVVTFPLLLDRNAGVDTAIRTSVDAFMMNPGPIALWGLIVAGGLVAGAVPLLVGLIVVMPVLGHATWHLYRKLVPR